jgi:hypothetical protein
VETKNLQIYKWESEKSTGYQNVKASEQTRKVQMHNIPFRVQKLVFNHFQFCRVYTHQKFLISVTTVSETIRIELLSSSLYIVIQSVPAGVELRVPAMKNQRAHSKRPELTIRESGRIGCVNTLV